MSETIARSAQYRGFTMSVTPQKDNDDLWDCSYCLQRDGQSDALEVNRRRTLGGHADPESAYVAGFDVAKIEVDNLLRP